MGSAADGRKVLSLEEMRRRVEARVEEETEASEGGGGGEGGDLEPAFIHSCISANEMGDGELFKRIHRGRYLYNKAMKQWLKWAGHHWEYDQLDESAGAVESVVDAYQAEAARLTAELREIDDQDTRRSLEKLRDAINKRVWALRGEARRDKCLNWAHKSIDPLAIFGDELDAKPWLLACPNCVVDLKTGHDRAGRPEDFLMKAASATWRGLSEPCDVWIRTLLEIFDWDESLVEFLQRLLGYSLIGAVYEAVFPCFIGPGGRNGKSTIMETIKSVLGPLAGPIPNEMLMASFRTNSGNSPTPDIMALRGLRLAWASEPEDGARVSAGRVKWLTGKDTLTGRYPHDKHPISFLPTHTLILLSNFRPHADTNDAAFWERLISVPFKLRFIRNREPRADNERRADIALDEKLRSEASGILAWMVRGCLAWQRKGLAPPPKVVEETADYFASEDNMGAFVDYCCLTGDEGLFECGASELYDIFQGWWKRHVGNFPPKQKKFGAYLKERYRSEKVGGVYRYYGIALNPDIVAEIMPSK